MFFPAARFDTIKITRMLEDFQALLRDIVAHPERRVLELAKASASAPSGLAATPMELDSSAYVTGSRRET